MTDGFGGVGRSLRTLRIKAILGISALIAMTTTLLSVLFVIAVERDGDAANRRLAESLLTLAAANAPTRPPRPS